MAIRVEPGNCLEVMRRLADEGVQVDAVVTDPPYGLNFMGQKWDGPGVVFNSVTWGTAAGLLKPGGHLLAFGGTRTYHRLVWAIEGGGFEVRDAISDLIASDGPVRQFMGSLNEEQQAAFLRCLDESRFGGMLSWLYGSGFPKSHDVNKGIDKIKRGELIRQKLLYFAKTRNVNGKWLESNGIASAKSFADWTTGGHVPSEKNWLIIKSALEVTKEEEAQYERKVLGSGNASLGQGQFHSREVNGGYGYSPDYSITAPATDEGAEWQGWGTALKPACEPICLARKCLSEPSVAANLLRHGTGALNVDGCRVGTEGGTKGATAGPSNGILGDGLNGAFGEPVEGLGRWPANVVHDGSPEVEEAFAVFGESSSPTSVKQGRRSTSNVSFGSDHERIVSAPGDTGTASRFFYTAKADAHDRWGSKHPTVKPIDLMRWLVRLVTPPGGTVLDPFAGSGTTAVACLAEGFDCILIEREEEYLADIRERLAFYSGEGRHSLSAKGRKRETRAEDLPLFNGIAVPAEQI